MPAISHTKDTATLTLTWAEALMLTEAVHRFREDLEALVENDYESDEEPDLKLAEHRDFANECYGMLMETYRAAHPRPV